MKYRKTNQARSAAISTREMRGLHPLAPKKDLQLKRKRFAHHREEKARKNHPLMPAIGSGRGGGGNIAKRMSHRGQ